MALVMGGRSEKKYGQRVRRWSLCVKGVGVVVGGMVVVGGKELGGGGWADRMNIVEMT